MKLPAFALLLLLGLPGTARAGEIVVAPGAVFTYSDPAGFCLVDPAMSSDEGKLFSMAQGSIGARSRFHLQILLVDCDRLTALRASEAALHTASRH